MSTNEVLRIAKFTILSASLIDMFMSNAIKSVYDKIMSLSKNTMGFGGKVVPYGLPW